VIHSPIRNKAIECDMAVANTTDTEGVVECSRGEFIISTDRERLSLDLVHGFLTNCYWAKGIPREVVKRSIQHALCFGIYDGEGAQVGFARVISDFATIAYIGDVFVLEPIGTRAGQVANAVHYSASRAAEPEALDFDHP